MRHVFPDYRMDERAADYAVKMLEDARAEGYGLAVISAYRSLEWQQHIFDYFLDSLIDFGYTPEDARVQAELEIALPGTSEHNAGIALDIVSHDYYLHNTQLTQNFDQTPEFSWLVNNCHKYGFIMRYPEGKTHITGFIYEPWHYRFVGVKRAYEISQSGLTLEEYFANNIEIERTN
ncbi:MAG: M15 family metallopeptidase [Oscillospiraceae bacterium]|nr:M15 family metallopeptidase [Oscillospiraceae bacterium]